MSRTRYSQDTLVQAIQFHTLILQNYGEISHCMKKALQIKHIWLCPHPDNMAMHWAANAVRLLMILSFFNHNLSFINFSRSYGCN